ncbi:MAG: putative toxin-antitoxin system toxin component, PIN family [Thermoleophilaceae bacterium]
MLPRVVLDANVLISGLIARGPPAALISAWLAGRFTLVVSPTLLAELEQVLRRPKLRRYATPQEVADFLAVLRRQAYLVDDPGEATPRLTPDPRDDYLVALARSADCLVSGDAHLTGLTDPSPPVLNARAFLDLLESA